MQSKTAERKYRTTEKKITKLLEQLPSESLLKLAKTTDQVEHWMLLRLFNVDLSKCWRAMHTGQDDPLAPLLKSKKINKTTHDYIWFTVDFHEKLWELVQISFRYVQPELERLQLEHVPESAFELFSKILSDGAEAEFAVCLKGYVELSGRKPVEEFQLASKLAKAEPLLPHEEKRIASLASASKLRQSFHNHPFLVATLAVCYSKVLGGRATLLKAKVEALHTALFNLIESEAKVCWHAKNIAWQDGQLGHGDKDGTYKFS